MLSYWENTCINVLMSFMLSFYPYENIELSPLRHLRTYYIIPNLESTFQPKDAVETNFVSVKWKWLVNHSSVLRWSADQLMGPQGRGGDILGGVCPAETSVLLHLEERPETFLRVQPVPQRKRMRPSPQPILSGWRASTEVALSLPENISTSLLLSIFGNYF